MEVEPQSDYVYFSIVQDNELEGLEEFVVFIECNIAAVKAARFSATICIIDDEKGTYICCFHLLVFEKSSRVGGKEFLNVS